MWSRCDYRGTSNWSRKRIVRSRKLDSVLTNQLRRFAMPLPSLSSCRDLPPMDWVEQNEKMASVELSRVFLIKIFIRLTQRTEENEKKSQQVFSRDLRYSKFMITRWILPFFPDSKNILRQTRNMKITQHSMTGRIYRRLRFRLLLEFLMRLSVDSPWTRNAADWAERNGKYENTQNGKESLSGLIENRQNVTME